MRTNVDVPVDFKDIPKDALTLGREIIKYRGMDYLKQFEYFPGACGCMGADKGYSKCPCDVSAELYKYKEDVIRCLLSEM